MIAAIPAEGRRAKRGAGAEMIKDVSAWTAWEEAGPLREAPDFQRNLRLVQAMYDLARSLGAFPPADAFAGLETDIRMARILNVRGSAGTHCPGA